MKHFNFLMLSARCVALSLFFPFLAVAQSSFGIQGGLHLSDATVSGPTPFVTSLQGNYFAGLTSRNPFAGRWAVSSDVQYTKRGFFLNQVQVMSENRTGFQLMYIDLASRIDYTIFKNVSLQMGGYTGYRAAEYGQSVGAEQWVKAVLPLTTTWDIGLQAGVSARFQRWSAFVRYSHGIKAVGRLEVTDELEIIKIYNRGLQMGAGYSIFNW